MRPTLLLLPSVNHRFPSGPVVIVTGPVPPRGNSVTAPDGAIRPTCPPLPESVNHMLPSGPAAMPLAAARFGCWNSVAAPDGVMRPTFPKNDSANHRLPSGPAAMLFGGLEPLGSGNSVTCGALPGAVVV